MGEARDKVIKEVSKLLKALECDGIRIKEAYLYGSYAVGTAHQDSDIDVAIVSEDFTGHWAEDFEKTLNALLQSDSRIELVRFHPEDFRDENPLVWEIKTKGIKVR